jgi:hypothetical protein
MNDTTKERLDKCREILRPVATDLIELAKADLTTQDGYGSVMGFLSSPEISKITGRLILQAMVEQGYPRKTAQSLAQIMGYPPV